MTICPEQTMWDIKGDLGNKIQFNCHTVSLGSFCWKNSELDKPEFQAQMSRKGIIVKLPFHYALDNNFAVPPTWIQTINIYNGPGGFQIFLIIRQEMIRWINQVIASSFNWFFPYLEKNCKEANIISLLSSSGSSALNDMMIIFQQFEGVQIRYINEAEANLLFEKSCVKAWKWK